MARRYRVTLTDTERDRLQALGWKRTAPARPVVCFDETSKQLVAETRMPLPIKPGKPERVDYEYARNGAANLFLVTQPLGAWRHIDVTARRGPRILRRLDFHYTPVHGSWLNMAELEFSMLARRCLGCRIGDRDPLATEIAAWETARNEQRATVSWQFTVDDARRKLHRLYPS